MAIKRLYFVGQTFAWLEAKRAALLDELTSGKRTIGAGAAGVRKDSQVETSAATVLQRIEHDLSILRPDKYPPASVARIRKSRPKYLY